MTISFGHHDVQDDDDDDEQQEEGRMLFKHGPPAGMAPVPQEFALFTSGSAENWFRRPSGFCFVWLSGFYSQSTVCYIYFKAGLFSWAMLRIITAHFQDWKLSKVSPQIPSSLLHLHWCRMLKSSKCSLGPVKLISDLFETKLHVNSRNIKYTKVYLHFSKQSIGSSTNKDCVCDIVKSIFICVVSILTKAAVAASALTSSFHTATVLHSLQTLLQNGLKSSYWSSKLLTHSSAWAYHALTLHPPEWKLS